MRYVELKEGDCLILLENTIKNEVVIIAVVEMISYDIDGLFDDFYAHFVGCV